MKIFIYFLLAVNLIGYMNTEAYAVDKNLEHSYVPKAGFIPTDEVAIKVAEAVLFNIYGKEQIESQKPYLVTDLGNEWIISGSIPPNRIGGTFLIRISKKDGKITLVTHSK